MGMKRKHLNKFKSAKKFRRHVSTTKAANMQIFPARGGWRL